MARPPLLAAALSLLAVLGCNIPETHVRRSSLMDYLYPKDKAGPGSRRSSSS